MPAPSDGPASSRRREKDGPAKLAGGAVRTSPADCRRLSLAALAGYPAAGLEALPFLFQSIPIGVKRGTEKTGNQWGERGCIWTHSPSAVGG